GILDENFLTLEFVEASKPNFVEKIIPSYFSISAGFMNELQHFLDSEPLDLKNVERLIHKIMGGSGSMGAAKLHALLKQLRLAGPPNKGSDNQEEDVESIASNDVNNN
ncbi:Histidine-containing phosphotransfer protein 4, partial [Bienertia sinuspersici]